MSPMDIIQLAKDTINLEAEAIAGIANLLNDKFAEAVIHCHQCKGRIVISGIGKSAIIAQKIVATFNSTGTPALYMHAADAIHGDIGMLLPDDVMVIISKSGESEEIKVLCQLVQKFGNTMIAICGNVQSYLATQAQYVLDTTVNKEACPNNLAPTTSTTAQMAMGDALAVCLLQLNGFNAQDFARVHPGGALGKMLYLRVRDLCIKNPKPIVRLDTDVRTVINTISGARLGATAVLDGDELAGIVTDGDLRRMMEKHDQFLMLKAEDIMTAHPKTIDNDATAVQALELMRQYNIFQLPVLVDGQYDGFVHMHDIIKEGIV
jgi:arabinose-5-phosphate isomerase